MNSIYDLISNTKSTQKEVQTFLNKNPGFNPLVIENAYGLNALNYSIVFGNIVVLNTLINKFGKEILNKTSEGRTSPFLIAVCSNLSSKDKPFITYGKQYHILKRLITFGANVNQSQTLLCGDEISGLAILSAALLDANGYYDDISDMCQLLISNGAKYFRSKPHEKEDDIRSLIRNVRDDTFRKKSSITFYTLNQVEECVFRMLPNELMITIAEEADLATPNNFNIFQA